VIVADYTLDEIILLDRPSETEKKYYAGEAFEFYTALYDAALKAISSFGLRGIL
jgi:hypothetical protein